MEWKKQGESGGTPLPTHQIPGIHSEIIEAVPALSATTNPHTDRHDVTDGPTGVPNQQWWARMYCHIGAVNGSNLSTHGILRIGQMNLQRSNGCAKAGRDDQRVGIAGLIPSDIHQVNIAAMEEDLRRAVISQDGWKSEYIRPPKYSIPQEVTEADEEGIMACRWWGVENPASGTSIIPYVQEYTQMHPVSEWGARMRLSTCHTVFAGEGGQS